MVSVTGCVDANILVERLGTTLRSEDLVCPVASGRVGVVFDPSTSPAAAHLLGERLVRSLRRSNEGHHLEVAVGMATRQRDDETSDALGSARRMVTAVRRVGPGAGTVAIDRPLVPGGSAVRGLNDATPVALHFRRIHVVPRDRRTVAPIGQTSPGQSASINDPDTMGPVLVVDPTGHHRHRIRPGAVSAVAFTRRAGWVAAAVIGPFDGSPPTSLDGMPVSVAVIVLDAPVHRLNDRWIDGLWGQAGRLAAAYQAARIPVVALDTGGGTGAVAACAVEGAVPLFDLEALPDLLDRVTSSSDGLTPVVATPVGFEALVSLTTAERRVLFYLTEGRTAQDIADHLVLAVTTVRFHIRSILRKLGVRSQLAAVALSGGRTFVSP